MALAVLEGVSPITYPIDLSQSSGSDPRQHRVSMNAMKNWSLADSFARDGLPVSQKRNRPFIAVKNKLILFYNDQTGIYLKCQLIT